MLKARCCKSHLNVVQFDVDGRVDLGEEEVTVGGDGGERRMLYRWWLLDAFFSQGFGDTACREGGCEGENERYYSGPLVDGWLSSARRIYKAR